MCGCIVRARPDDGVEDEDPLQTITWVGNTVLYWALAFYYPLGMQFPLMKVRRFLDSQLGHIAKINDLLVLSHGFEPTFPSATRTGPVTFTGQLD